MRLFLLLLSRSMGRVYKTASISNFSLSSLNACCDLRESFSDEFFQFHKHRLPA